MSHRDKEYIMTSQKGMHYDMSHNGALQHGTWGCFMQILNWIWVHHDMSLRGAL